MKRFGLCTLLGLGCALIATACYADALAPPKDLPPNAAAFSYSLRTDAEKDVSFLRISQQDLARFTQVLNQQKTSWSPPATRSIIAALAASIGIATVVLVRSNRNTKIAMLFVVGLFASSTAAEAWWNAPPPPPAPPAPPTAAASFTHNGLLVFAVKDNGAIELVIGTKAPPDRGNRNGPRIR